jgi:uncharacterized protein (UPF0262 family)
MDNHIATITLDHETLGATTPKIQHERDIAIADLIAGNLFAPKMLAEGPYHLMLTLSESRLIFDITTTHDAPGAKIAIPLKPLRMMVKDYQLICDSYAKALEAMDPRKIEAIDMGRRGLHNEASQLLIELLETKLQLDFETARRLFTLIFVLHLK